MAWLQISLAQVSRQLGSAGLREISQRLAQESQVATVRSVTICADKRLPYGEVIAVLDLVQQANMRDIAVAVH